MARMVSKMDGAKDGTKDGTDKDKEMDEGRGEKGPTRQRWRLRLGRRPPPVGIDNIRLKSYSA